MCRRPAASSSSSKSESCPFTRSSTCPSSRCPSPSWLSSYAALSLRLVPSGRREEHISYSHQIALIFLPATTLSPPRTPRCSPCHPRRRARRKSRGPGLGWQRPMQRRRKHRRRSPRTRSRGKCAGLPSPKRCAPIPVLLALACAVPSPFACTPSGAGALRKALHLCLGLRGCGEQWPQRHHDGKRIQGAVRRPAQRDA